MKYVFLASLLITSVSALGDEWLTNGQSVTEENRLSLKSISIPYAVVRQGQRTYDDAQTVMSFVEMDGSVYSLSSNARLLKTKTEDRVLDGNWLIDAFNDPALEPEIKSLYANYNVENGVRTIDNTKQFPVGCLIKNSLRYGDITGDSKPELAIFAQNQYGAVNISFFSIEAKKIIFQYRAISNDAQINLRKELEDGETLSETYPLANKPDDPQYLSVIVEENTPKVTAIGPAVIQFAKIYTADFDGDEKLDLVTWRKLYSSRENQDSIEGFRKIQDQLIHYKLVDDEYKKQPTESRVVKGWLTAKNLNWKKGYPSKSECAGQEGQFIAEMHDPLLNDPDVLQ